MFNQDITNELVARGMIDRYLFGYLNHLTSDTNKLSKILRRLSSSLSIGDIEQISQNFGQNVEANDNTFIEEIEKFGVKVPKLEKEIDETLGRPASK